MMLVTLLMVLAVVTRASHVPAPPSFEPHYTVREGERALPTFKPHYTSFAPPAPTASTPSLARREVVHPASVEGGPFSDKPHSNISAVAFPTSQDWYTLGETMYVLWSWGETHNPYLRVVLNHNDTKLLPGALTLDEMVPANMFGVVVNSTLHAAAGSGYTITLHDVANMSLIYATSAAFEIRPAGTQPTVPWPYSTFSPSSSAASTALPSLAIATVGALLAIVLL